MSTQIPFPTVEESEKIEMLTWLFLGTVEQRDIGTFCTIASKNGIQEIPYLEEISNLVNLEELRKLTNPGSREELIRSLIYVAWAGAQIGCVDNSSIINRFLKSNYLLSDKVNHFLDQIWTLASERDICFYLGAAQFESDQIARHMERWGPYLQTNPPPYWRWQVEQLRVGAYNNANSCLDLVALKLIEYSEFNGGAGFASRVMQRIYQLEQEIELRFNANKSLYGRVVDVHQQELAMIPISF